MHRLFPVLLAVTLFFLTPTVSGPRGLEAVQVPILVYHRFGPAVADSMTITTRKFEAQLRWLVEHGHQVIPLRMLIEHLRGHGPPPPPGAVVITVDDGHLSVYRELLPLIRKYRFPCTLFIYPSAISNASYALTWEQLAEIQATGLVEVQSHTYWHPNFHKDSRRLSPEDYRAGVRMQLARSRSVLEKRLAVSVDLLAWPFGIHDPWLEEEARRAGYAAAFTIERHHVSGQENLMALPRYMVLSDQDIAGIVSQAGRGSGSSAKRRAEK